MLKKVITFLLLCLLFANAIEIAQTDGKQLDRTSSASAVQCKCNLMEKGDSVGEQWVFFKDLQLISTYRGNVTTETVINFANIVPMESKASKIKLVLTARDTNQPGNTALSLWTVRISIKNGQQEFVHWQKYGAASVYGVGIGYSETIELPCTQSRQIIVSCSKKMASMAVDFEISGVYK